MKRNGDFRAIAHRLGFSPFEDVRSRPSIADLFPRSRRCGLYALSFGNGEGYIGRTIDVVRRFAGHRANHEDIVEIAFRPLTADLQDREERAAIATCEQAGMLLRNVQFASVVLGETDLDLVISPAEQSAWLKKDVAGNSSSDRVDDSNLRRKYRRRFDELCRDNHWAALGPILQAYAATCIPAPAKTELSFWSISCLPGVGSSYARMLARININAQEVFGAFAERNSLGCAFQVRKSIIDRAKLRWPPWVEVTPHRYAPGGHDQVRLTIWDENPGDILRLVAVPAFRSAAKDFNLNLMRKGANLNARSHCFDLADVLLDH